jgi:hypothetical protein
MTDRMRRVTARNGRMALACALGVLLTTAPAAAQNSEQIVEIESYRIPGWSFTPSVAVGTVYDNNIGLTAPRADLGQTQGDTVFNVVPGAQLEYIRKRTDFSVGYRGFVRRYLSVDGLDSFDQRASMGLKHLVSRRLTLFARDSYLDTPTTDETELNGVPFRRTGSRNNTFAAGSEYRVTKFVKLSTRYDSTWVAFDRPEIYLTGGWIHALRNELSYQVSKHVSLGGEYAYRRAALDEGQRRFDFQDMGGVAHFALSAHTEASAAGGYATLRDHNFTRRAPAPTSVSASPTCSTAPRWAPTSTGSTCRRSASAVRATTRSCADTSRCRCGSGCIPRRPRPGGGRCRSRPRRSRSTASGCAPRSATARRDGCGSKRSTRIPARTRS